MRLLRAAALAVLLSSLDTGASVAQNGKVTAGDVAKCDPFRELISDSVVGRFQVNWQPIDRGSGPSKPHRGGPGVVILPSPTAPASIRFERRRASRMEKSGEIVTFSLGSGASLQAQNRLQAMAECKRVEKEPVEACILDDDSLAATFSLPLLTATRDRSSNNVRSILGNIYQFYGFKDRYWLAIVPLDFTAGPRWYFGFSLNAPEALATGRAPALFDQGCQLDWASR